MLKLTMTGTLRLYILTLEHGSGGGGMLHQPVPQYSAAGNHIRPQRQIDEHQ